MSTGDTRGEKEPSWRRLYAVILGELALTIAIFYAFTKAFQ
jgi:hypothetical protein